MAEELRGQPKNPVHVPHTVADYSDVCKPEHRGITLGELVTVSGAGKIMGLRDGTIRNAMNKMRKGSYTKPWPTPIYLGRMVFYLIRDVEEVHARRRVWVDTFHPIPKG